jgi:hypothetical protein
MLKWFQGLFPGGGGAPGDLSSGNHLIWLNKASPPNRLILFKVFDLNVLLQAL